MATAAEREAIYAQILAFARDDKADSIRDVIRLGCPPTYCNRMGQSALHVAAIWGSLEAVKALLDLRADPHQQNELRGSNPLHAAGLGKGPAAKRAEAVRLMMQAKGDPLRKDRGGETAIDCADCEEVRIAMGAPPLVVHQAVLARNAAALTDAIQSVRGRGAILTLEDPDLQGNTALQLAVAQRWTDGVDRLLAARAGIDCRDNRARTPLHTATISGDISLVRTLLVARADASLVDRDPDGVRNPKLGGNPMQHRSALHYASELGNVLAMRLLTDLGRADPNASDSMGHTPIQLAMGMRQLGGEELEPGCGVRAAGLSSRPELNGLLGATIGEKVEQEGSVFRWPVLLEGQKAGILLREENLKRLPDDTVVFLIAARADVNLGNSLTGETRTLLHEAAGLGDEQLTSLVLAARADISRRDEHMGGLSALHTAARSKRIGVAKLLVAARADLKQTTDQGRTARDLATANGASADLVALLAGASPGASEAAPTPSGASSFKPPPRRLAGLSAEERAKLFID